MQDETQQPESVAVPQFCPVTGGERLISLDVLRGIAVLGILVMNIYAFAMPFQAYMISMEGGGTETHNLASYHQSNHQQENLTPRRY